MLMYHAAIIAAANGTRSAHTIAAIVGVSYRMARRVCRSLNLPLGNA